MWIVSLIFNRLKIQEWFVVGGVIMTVALLLFYRGQAQDAEVEKRISEDALAGWKTVQEIMGREKTIDQTIVVDWVKARDAYRAEQADLINATFTKYQALSLEPAPPLEETSRDAPVKTTPTPAPPGLTVEQLNVLTRGMRESYCRAQAQADSVHCSTDH